MEKVITTKRGVYGRVNITLPLPVKISLFDMQKKTGLKKAEFLRLALTTGLVELSNGKSVSESKTSQIRPQGGPREGGLPGVGACWPNL